MAQIALKCWCAIKQWFKQANKAVWMIVWWYPVTLNRVVCFETRPVISKLSKQLNLSLSSYHRLWQVFRLVFTAGVIPRTATRRAVSRGSRRHSISCHTADGATVCSRWSAANQWHACGSAFSALLAYVTAIARLDVDPQLATVNKLERWTLSVVQFVF